MDRPPRTAPRDAARRLFAAGFLDLSLLTPRAAAGPAEETDQVLAGRFELRAELGRGAAGVVWRAFDRSSQREVALKLLKRSGPSAVERFLREGQLAAGLEHPNLVRVYEAGSLQSGPFLVFELVSGATPLEEALPRLTWPERLARITEVAAALAHAHARGVVHRDLKPANVLIDAEGRARVTDFGVGWGPDLETLTATGASVGTPAAMAPEQIQARAGRRDPPVDVWALGVLIYLAATDRFPFEGQTLGELASAILGGRYPALSRLAPHVPTALARICERCLRSDPRERYPDAGALRAALTEASHAPPGRLRRTHLLAGLGALAVGLAIAVAVGLRRGAAGAGPRPETPTLAARTPAKTAPQAPDTPPTPSAATSPVSARVVVRPTRIVGYLERVDARGEVSAWAANEDAPDRPVQVTFIVTTPTGEEVVRIAREGSQPRGDVKTQRGLTGVHYGFRFALPERLRNGQPYRLFAWAQDPGGGLPRSIERSPLAFRLPLPIERGPHELLSDPSFGRGISLAAGPVDGPRWRLTPPRVPGTRGQTVAPRSSRGGPTWALRLLQVDELLLGVNGRPSTATAERVEVEQTLTQAPTLGALKRLRLQLDVLLRSAERATSPAGRSRFGVTVLAARGSTTVACRLDLYSEPGPATPGVTALTPAPRKWAYARVDRDMLPLLRAAAKASGLTPRETAALRPTGLRVGWVAARGFAGGASVRDLSLSAPRGR